MDYYKNLDPRKLDMNKQFWKTFGTFFSSKLLHSEKIILIEDEEIITDDLSISEIMASHFSNITDSLNILKWPDPFPLSEPEDAVSRAVRKYSNHPSIIKIKSLFNSDNKFEFNHILPAKVGDQINKLKVSKSSRGNIPTKILKACMDLYILSLTDIMNNSVSDKLYPSDMKLADLVSFFKKGDNTLKINYRPISILSAFSKVFERILAEQITEFMSEMFSPYLCGFRKGFGTQHALLKLLEDWRKYLDNKEIIGTILCDLSKAFDTLSHDLIIAKLEAYGFGPNSLAFIYDYLTDRKQRCKIGTSYSSWYDITCGVPQGSVMGPLLFNIFMNDFLLFTIEAGICNFADDNSIYVHGNDIDTVINSLEIQIRKAIDWYKYNSLVPNPDKFQMMFLGTKKKIDFCLDINGKVSRSTTDVKLLGITIDWKLTFNKHVYSLCKGGNKKASALVRLRNDLDTSQKAILYSSFVSSIFGYCPVVWMFCGKTADLLINRVQCRALGAVYNDFGMSFNELCSLGNHDSIHLKNLKCLLVEVFKSLHNESPAILSNIFKQKDTLYNLRRSQLLELPKTSTKTYGLCSFSYRGSITWNSIPDQIKDAENSSIFKNKIKSLNEIVCNCKICF